MHPVLHAFLSQTAADGQSPGAGALSFLPFVAIAFVFYFFVIRPQGRAAKQQQTFVSALKKGDEVVTQSGIIGTISVVEDRSVTLDVGAGTKLRVIKSQISGPWKQVESTPVKAEAKK